jgi:hypothetical protein
VYIAADAAGPRVLFCCGVRKLWAPKTVVNCWRGLWFRRDPGRDFLSPIHVVCKTDERTAILHAVFEESAIVDRR